MAYVSCPSCHGAGKVTAEEAVEIYEHRERTGLLGAPPGQSRRGGICSCDGPPHTYDPVRPDPQDPARRVGWCPASGPVTHRA